ncbi:hypothetical protein Poli38472_000286 [Pythium oligandrum]|uniref:Uncharacterized protein n=1 Tax=Pythium oligandrum TaxID=41045 RepID=A0A8K1CC03_PYTOL|nr:hypothetical protein Poli38472_000286 [Pythium oligandrum]|eukprot:TMW60244.1 hypothetical protein Poli38472_000286 [Pythium oligandrum]
MHKLKKRTNTTVAVEHKVATYRNAYGSHFECSSTCYFIMLAYSIGIAFLLVLLAVIPVRSPMSAEEAPFLIYKDNQGNAVAQRGMFGRFVLWLAGSAVIVEARGDAAAKIENQDDLKERFHEDVEAIADKFQEVSPSKTFESVAVATDDLVFSPPPPRQPPRITTDDCVLIDDVDRLFDFPGKSPQGSKKPGIFSPVTPKATFPDKTGGDSVFTFEQTSPSSSRCGSLLPDQIKRKSIGAGSAVSEPENVIAAVERRNSMLKRVEKRKEQAKSDIKHDQLDDRELEMYEYLEFVRELLEGITIKKICQKSSRVVKRFFFINPTLSVVYWNKVGNKNWISKKSSVECAAIDKVVKGINASPNLEHKGKAAKQALYLSLLTNKGRRLDLEAKDEALRQRLYRGFTRLAKEKREEKARREAEGDSAGTPSALSPSESRHGSVGATEARTGGDPSSRREPSVIRRVSAEAERMAKAEEDDPKHWREEAEESDEEGDEDETNQGDNDD